MNTFQNELDERLKEYRRERELRRIQAEIKRQREHRVYRRQALALRRAEEGIDDDQR